jgi:hypothetical protein
MFTSHYRWLQGNSAAVTLVVELDKFRRQELSYRWKFLQQAQIQLELLLEHRQVWLELLQLELVRSAQLRQGPVLLLLALVRVPLDYPPQPLLLLLLATQMGASCGA